MQRRVRARNQNRYRPLKPPAPQKSCRRENRRQLFLGSEGKVAERSVVAPARDATIYFNHTAIDNDVSIHAPTRGATGVTAATLHETINFNPRTRIGATEYFYFIGLGPNISTHAPARGATFLTATAAAVETLFQPTPPHGVRQQTCIKANTCLPFYYIFCTDPCQSSRNFFCRPSSFSIFSYVVGADLPGNPCALAIRTALNADPFSLFSPKGYCLQGLALAGEVQRRKWPSVWGDKKPPRRCPARQGGHKFYLTSVTSKWG